MSQTNTPSYVSGLGNAARAAHARRTIDNSITYLKPYLDQARPDFVLLDVGCGPGSISLDIAKQFPSATVIGVDGNPEAVKQARAAAVEAKLTNAKFTVGDVLNLEQLHYSQDFEGLLPREGCDIVHAHQVLQHVTDPLGLLKQMRALARQDAGLVALREADWGIMTAWPEHPAIDLYHELFCKLSRARGSDPLVGRKMVGLALQAGWRREQINASEKGWVYSTPEERRWWSSSTIDRWSDDSASAKEALAQGFIQDTKPIEEIRRAWTEWAEKEDGWYTLPCPQIVCRNS